MFDRLKVWCTFNMYPNTFFRLFITSIILFCMLLTCDGSTKNEFVIGFGGDRYDGGTALQETKDGSFVVAGGTKNWNVGNVKDVLLSKFSSFGVHQWTKTFGTTKLDTATSLHETKEGGFIITGSSEIFSQGQDKQDMILLKVDSDGEYEWSKIFGGKRKDYSLSVHQTMDGNFVVSGCTFSYGDGTVRYFLLAKFATDGSLVWSIVYGGSDRDCINSVTEMKDGSIVVVGYSGTTNSFIYLSKFCNNGTHIWSRGMGGAKYDLGMSVQETKSGELVITGYCRSRYVPSQPIKTGSLALLSKVSSDGKHLWSIFFGGEQGSDHGKTIRELSDGGFIISGSTSSFSQDSDNILLSAWNSDGTHRWTKTYGGSDEDDGLFAQETGDGSIIVTGRLYNMGFSAYFAFLSKVDPDSGISDSCSWKIVQPYIFNVTDTIPFRELHPNITHFNLTVRDFNVTIQSVTPSVDYKCSTCFGHTSDTTEGCSGHGSCISPGQCGCFEGYHGQACDVFSCFGILSNQTDETCHGHGRCLAENECSCDHGYNSDSNCTFPECFGISSSLSGVCYGHGRCDLPNQCVCDEGYVDDDCKSWECFGIIYSSRKTCSRRGVCVSPNLCFCDSGFTRHDCSYHQSLAIGLGLGIPGIVMASAFLGCCVTLWLCLCLLFSFCCCTFVFSSGLYLVSQLLKLRKSVHKFTQLDDFDVLLQEQLLDKDRTIPHLRIRKELFEIAYEEISVLEIIGSGGSDAKVFKVKWRGKVVAFKCFQTRKLLSNQNCFDSFEKELNLLANLSHPNIITFFGATLKPPRVGIIMEFCENGELFQFLINFKEQNGKRYHVLEKIRFCREICYAMEFIHSRNVIHRDLKCENVLVDSSESCKLMDFGISRVIEEQNEQKTRKIGTTVYIAPEVMTGMYDQKCDCFSFAILLFIIFSENDRPYGENVFNIELKVANSPSFRPPVKEIEGSFQQDENEKNSFELVKNVMVRCWDHDPDRRYSFSELVSIFEMVGRKGPNVSSSQQEEVEESKSYHKTLKTEEKMDVNDDDDVEIQKENVILRNENQQLKNMVDTLKNENQELNGKIRDLQVHIEKLKGST